MIIEVARFSGMSDISFRVETLLNDRVKFASKMEKAFSQKNMRRFSEFKKVSEGMYLEYSG